MEPQCMLGYAHRRRMSISSKLLREEGASGLEARGGRDVSNPWIPLAQSSSWSTINHPHRDQYDDDV